MASERLIISEKDRIAKSIIKPIIEQSKKEFEELKNSIEAKIFVNKMIELDRKASNIKNRTKCALENINTTKQLKDNFPEAYAIFMKIPKEDVKGNECDDIEKLRAELSKL